jgi:hypothetical protein
MLREALMALLAVTLVTGTAAAQVGQRIRIASVPGRSTVDGIPANTRLHLSAFRPVAGTPALMASISEGEAGSRPSSVSAWPRPTVRNYVFCDLSSDELHAILPDNRSLVVSVRTLTTAGKKFSTVSEVESSSESAEALPKEPSSQQVLWHLFEVVTADTNGDGQLTGKDRRALGVTDAFGRDYAVVVPSLDDVFAETLLDPQTLHLIHGSQAKQVAVRINLPQRQITSTKPLANLLAQ